MRGIFAAQASACKQTLGMLVVCCLLIARGMPAAAGTLEVGPMRALKSPSAAAVVAKDGDSVILDPGVYRDCAIWYASRLTIEARRAPPTMNKTVMTQTIVTGPTCGDRALFYFVGNDITVRGISFQHARDTQFTGAGILMEGDNLTVENASFLDNENGILAGGSSDSVILVRRSWFQGNGSCQGSCAHALYVGARIARLEVLGCLFQDTHVGHDIKSRARSTMVRDTRIDDGSGGTASYLIELPDSGDAEIVNNTLRKGTQSENKEVAISIGTESARNRTHSLEIRGNRFTSDLPEPVWFVRDLTPVPARLVRNTLVGLVIPLKGPGTVE